MRNNRRMAHATPCASAIRATAGPRAARAHTIVNTPGRRHSRAARTSIESIGTRQRTYTTISGRKQVYNHVTPRRAARARNHHRWSEERSITSAVGDNGMVGRRNKMFALRLQQRRLGVMPACQATTMECQVGNAQSRTCAQTMRRVTGAQCAPRICCAHAAPRRTALCAGLNVWSAARLKARARRSVAARAPRARVHNMRRACIPNSSVPEEQKFTGSQICWRANQQNTKRQTLTGIYEGRCQNARNIITKRRAAVAQRRGAGCR